jgi:uncharacterized protein (DUF2267 family)
MNHDAFLGEIQHRLELATKGEAMQTTRLVLTTLGERIGEGEASDLAAQLPMEIDRHLTVPMGGQQFSYQAFLERIAEQTNTDKSTAQFHAQAVIALVDECVAGGEMAQVRAQLPDSYEPLFEFADSKAEATPW